MIGRRTWIGLGLATALLAAGAGGYVATTARGFDSDKWKAQRHSGARDNPRAGMLGALEKLLHVGMTQNEVLAPLGEPDSKQGTLFTYNLGVPGFGVDYEHFHIEFDGAENSCVAGSSRAEQELGAISRMTAIARASCRARSR